MRRANLCLALQLCATVLLCTLPIAPRAHAAGADGSWMPQWGGAPRPMAVAFDTHLRRLVGFGSLSGSPENAKVWIMSVDSPTIWTNVPTAGAGPTRILQGASFTFDPRRGRYLLCGGIQRSASDRKSVV